MTTKARRASALESMKTELRRLNYEITNCTCEVTGMVHPACLKKHRWLVKEAKFIHEQIEYFKGNLT